jgi:hypothetical protein
MTLIGKFHVADGRYSRLGLQLLQVSGGRPVRTLTRQSRFHNAVDQSIWKGLKYRFQSFPIKQVQ